MHDSRLNELAVVPLLKMAAKGLWCINHSAYHRSSSHRFPFISNSPNSAPGHFESETLESLKGIGSVDDVVCLLSKLNGSKFCVGNNDPEFLEMAEGRRNCFKDKSGTFWIAYHSRDMSDSNSNRLPVTHWFCEPVASCSCSLSFLLFPLVSMDAR